MKKKRTKTIAKSKITSSDKTSQIKSKPKFNLKKLASKKPIKKTYTHHADHYNKSESYLIENKSEDLQEAWFKIREFGESLGTQKIYASGRAIMFSKKVCYFFVRPKKTFLEIVIFLTSKKSKQGFHSIREATKTKWAHTFKLIHADQVDGELAVAITEAYAQTPEAKA